MAMNAAATALEQVSCGACGATLWRSEHYWACPHGHGKLIAPETLVHAVRDADPERFTRLRGARRFLARLQREQRRGGLYG